MDNLRRVIDFVFNSIGSPISASNIAVALNKNSDIVQKNAKEREYYQVAYTVSNEKTFNREMVAFKNLNDNHPKYLITMDFDNSSIDGIKKINIDWLLESLS